MLAELMPDVPRTTLYRHVNLLHQEGYLKILKEVRIRGTYEREYELDKERLGGESPKEKERQATFDLLLKMLGDFETYYESPESDSGRDMLFFTGNSLKLTDEEFSGFLEELFALIARYDLLPKKEGQKVRSITMISAPAGGELKRKGGEDKKKAESKEEKTEAEKTEADTRQERAEIQDEEPASLTQPEEKPEESPHRSAFLEAMERLNGTKRKLTDPKEGDRAIHMPADATYDMADKIQQFYHSERKAEYDGKDE